MTQRVVVGVAVAVVSAILGAPTAHAEGMTRYWSYWNSSDGVWSYATQGAGTTIPPDGGVEGWTFVVTEGLSDEAGPPQVIPEDAWRQACGDAQPTVNEKAVAVVLDFGTADIAPAGETPPPPRISCAVVDASANGFQVLSAVTEVRADGGFLCGIAGYPREECAPIIESLETRTSAPSPVTPVAAESPAAEASGTPWWTLGVLVLVAAAALLLWRRRR